MSVAEYVAAIEDGTTEAHHVLEPGAVITEMMQGINTFIGRSIASIFEAPTENHVILEDASMPRRYTLIIYILGLDGSSTWRQPHGDSYQCADADALKTDMLALLGTPEVAHEIELFELDE